MNENQINNRIVVKLMGNDSEGACPEAAPLLLIQVTGSYAQLLMYLQRLKIWYYLLSLRTE
ncbi:hypothetical protein QFZ78_000789 [Paenibacillus sp. V4I5]|nr:hypothetical protein [Paenibacillus sp. V4I5]